MAQEGVFTNIDAFVRYLNEHGETEGSALAAALGVSEKNVEDWAKVLESSHMAKITYRMGKIFIAPMSEVRIGGNEARQMGQVKKAVVVNEINAQAGDLTGMEQKIESLNNAVAASTEILNKNSGPVREALEKLRKLQEQADAPFGQIRQRKEEIDRLSSEFEEMMRALTGNTNIAQTIMQNKSNAAAALEDLKSKIHEMAGSSESMLKDYDNKTREERKRLIEFSKNSRSEIESMMGLVKEDEKELNRYEKIFKDYTNESAKARKSLDKNKADLIDRIAKAKDEVGTVYASAEAESKKAGEVISKAKEGLEGFEALKKEIASIKEEIDTASKEIAEQKRQVASLQQQLKGLGGGETGGKEGNKVSEIDEEARRAKDDAAKTSSRISRARKRFGDLSKGR